MAEKWFSQAGNLDDSLDSESASISTSDEPALITKNSVKTDDASPKRSTYIIKPVKGLKENPDASFRSELEPSSTNSLNLPIASVKEETRCKECGAVIPKGTMLCWKCSTSAGVADEKAVKPEKHEIVSSKGTVIGKNRKPIMVAVACVVLILVVGLIFVLVTGSQKLDLKSLVCTDEILNYQLEDGTMIKSTVQSFEVVSSQTKDKHDCSEIKVVLKDDFLERTLYITSESSKYNQGWMIDSKKVTQADFKIIGEIDQEYVTAYLSNERNDTENLVFQQPGLDLVQSGLKNFSITSSTVQDDSFFLVCDVNDSHKFADIHGTLYVRVNINMFIDPDTCECTVRRSVRLDTEALITDWHDIYGTYLRTDPENELEEYVTIDETNSAYGYGDYMEFGQQRHNLIDDASFIQYNYSTILIEFYSVNGYSIIKITPDEIAYFESKLDGWHKVDSFIKTD